MDGNKKVVSAPKEGKDVLKQNINSITDTNLYTVDGKLNRGVSERTLKKRLARLVSSRAVLLLAVLVSLSAILSCFRGYMWPVTVFLVIERVVLAVGLWLLYLSAGKKATKLLAVLPVYSGIIGIVGMLFLAVFIGSAMFGKLLLMQTESSVELVRVIYKANLWSVIPVLVCVMVAYCAFLFYRSQWQLLSNLRDGLKYGFAFEQGYKSFTRGCAAMAVALLCLRVAMAVFGDFSFVGFISEKAVPMFNSVLLPHGIYAMGLISVIVEAVALVLAGVLACRYANAVKKYKTQKKAQDKAEKSAIEGAKAVIDMENEKLAARSRKK